MASTTGHGWKTMSDCPDELILHILGYISIRNRYDLDLKSWKGSAEIESRVKDLRSLALLSRRFYRIANPELYSVLASCGHVRNRRNFLRTILRRPDLAALVKEVRFSWFDWIEDRRGIPSEYSDILEAAKLVDFGGEAQNTAFQSSLKEGFNDADVALLFSQLPNLEMLELETDETWFHTWQWLLRLLGRTTGNGTGPFDSLRHLKIRYGDENKSGFNPLFLQDWVALPSLRTIDVSGAWTQERDGGRTLSLPTNGNIEHLTFWASGLDNDFIERALTSFTGLREFCIDWKTYLISSFVNDPEAFHRALSNRRDTLERLSILLLADPLEYYFLAIRRNTLLEPLGSFKDFTRLKHLEISHFLLTGMPYLDALFAPPTIEPEKGYAALVDTLPESLELLRIGYSKNLAPEYLSDHTVQFFGHLFGRVAKMPSFRCLELLPHGETAKVKNNTAHDEILQRITELSYQSDIPFRVVSLGRFDHGGYGCPFLGERPGL